MNSRGSRFGIACALALATTLVVAGLASATTVTYTQSVSGPVIGEGDSRTSTLVVPPGRTPVADVEVAGLSMQAFGQGSDDDGDLVSPAGGEVELFGPICGGPFGEVKTWDIADGGDPYPMICADIVSGSTYAPAEPLSAFEGGPSSGTWRFTLATQDGTTSWGNWGLRIEHAPFVLKAKAKKQPLQKKLKARVKCNADCDLTVKGQVKTQKLQLQQDDQQKLKLKLKPGPLQSLEPGDKAKVVFKATDPLGDSVKKKKRIKLT
jgi:hypothetical protein